MKCDCGSDTRTKDTRKIEQGVWRRRACPSCGAEFTTLEQRCETLKVPYTSKKNAAVKKGQVVAPPVPKVARPNPANKRAVALREAPAVSARDRIEDMKFERSQREHGWDE